MSHLRIGLAGSLGALSRYGVGLLVAGLVQGPFPWGTLLINLVGSFLLGLLTGLGTDRNLIPPVWRVPLTTGFLGAFTTFSTFSVETVRLVETGHGWAAFAYVAISISFGLPAAWLGLSLGRQRQPLEELAQD